MSDKWSPSSSSSPNSDGTAQSLSPTTGGDGGYSTNYIIAVGPQVFRVTCTGMKPSTLHQAYLLSTLVSVDCAPLNNYYYGAPLISDANGVLIFDYKFNPVNSPYTTRATTAGTVAVIPAGNQKFSVASADNRSRAYNYILQK